MKERTSPNLTDRVILSSTDGAYAAVRPSKAGQPVSCKSRAKYGGMREDALFDSSESIITVVVAVLIAYAVVLWLGTIVWAYRDIRGRTHDAWTQTVSIFIVVAFNLPGLILYLVLRPQETLSDIYERRLEAEALMRDLPQPQPACPSCKHSVDSDFLVCPNCRTRLREACANCARALELSWAACPYCAAAAPGAAAGKATSTATSEPPRPASQQTPSAPGATSIANQAPSAAGRESERRPL